MDKTQELETAIYQAEQEVLTVAVKHVRCMTAFTFIELTKVVNNLQELKEEKNEYIKTALSC